MSASACTCTHTLCLCHPCLWPNKQMETKSHVKPVYQTQKWEESLPPFPTAFQTSPSSTLALFPVPYCRRGGKEEDTEPHANLHLLSSLLCPLWQPMRWTLCFCCRTAQYVAAEQESEGAWAHTGREWEEEERKVGKILLLQQRRENKSV